MDLVGKVMSLLFNTLSRLVITFLPRSKRLLISWLQSPSVVILEPPKIKSVTFPSFLFRSHCFIFVVAHTGWGILTPKQMQELTPTEPRRTFVLSGQSYGFSSGHVWM